MEPQNVESILGVIEEGVHGSESVFGVLKAIDQFQQDPSILEDRLPEFIATLVDGFFTSASEYQHRCSQVFYTFAKVCGIKKVMNHLSTDIFLLPKILEKLKDSGDWQDSFLLLAWLKMILMSPFKLENDSQIYEMTGKFKVSQALHPLVSAVHAELFAKNIKLFHLSLSNGLLDLYTVNYTLKAILRQGQVHERRAVLDLPALNKLTSFCIDSADSTNEVKLRLTFKILPKLCKLHAAHGNWEVIEDIASWLLGSFNVPFTELRFQLAHNFVKIMQLFMTLDSDSAFSLIESIVYDARDTLSSNPTNTIDEDTLHTQLLVIAESSRIELLSPELLKLIAANIIPITIKFQQTKINKISGHQVRDATNFVCWSFARNCDIASESENLFLNSLMCSLLDRDLLIRRSSAAALQEILGRFGNTLLKREDVMRVIELPNKNLETSYLQSVPRLLKIFKGTNSKYSNALLDWLLDYNILQNNDLHIVKLTCGLIRILLEKQGPSYLPEYFWNHISESASLVLKGGDVLKKCCFTYLATEAQLLENDIVKKCCSEWLPTLLAIINPRSPNLSERFKTLCVLKLLHYYANENKDFSHFDDHTLDVLFQIVRHRSLLDDDYEEVKMSFVSLVSIVSSKKGDTELTGVVHGFQQRFEALVRQNNPLCCAGLAYIDPDQFVETFQEFCPHMDCEARREVVSGISDRLSGITAPKKLPILTAVVALLDDYTVTDRGDVGSLVRNRVVELIEKHRDIFMQTDPSLKSIVCSKLLRIAAEPNEKLRQKSFQVLAQGHDFDHSGCHDSAILNFYQKFYEDQDTEFWAGFMFSAGAIHSTDQLIRTSIDNFLIFYEGLPKLRKLNLLNYLVRILPSSSEIEAWQTSKEHKNSMGCQKKDLVKQALTSITFWRRVLESGMDVDPAFNAMGAYAKFYNLHLTKKFAALTIAVIRLMPYIAISFTRRTPQEDRKFANVILKRLKSLACRKTNSSKLTQIQSMSFEGMAIIYLAFEDGEKAIELEGASRKDPQSLLDFEESI
ncbi:LAQU0S01e15346g1_1 [Lachancea quebecensis]|uniref:LAQU0S01e15346g1_1 n=1 Tax=Lachancea quebecensis TaxID=1654605 RepID=A0A0P1KN49_9SACH|nr:LAQU0S01e15346g1_1 [Lachancea quebecensis]